MDTLGVQKQPRVVNMVGSYKGDEVKPFVLSFLEEVPQHSDMAGGHQTYYATGTKQDVSFDPD